jgi:hypothetical protein
MEIRETRALPFDLLGPLAGCRDGPNGERSWKAVEHERVADLVAAVLEPRRAVDDLS